MQDNGHKFLFFARERYPIQDLLAYYKIPYINRGKGSNTMLGKLLYIPKAVYTIYKYASKFKPDLFIDYGDFYAAFNAFFLRAYYIALDDTESGWMCRVLHMPFTHAILTPDSFMKNLGRKHLRYPGTIELAYLHPKRFNPNPQVLSLLGISDKERYAIVRFTSWNAHHDVGHRGITYENKIMLVKELAKHLKVFVSAESEIPVELNEYGISIKPELMHHALFYAWLLIGESGTMSSESSLLGTPAIFIHNSHFGCIDEQAEFGLIHTFGESKDEQCKAIAKAMEIAQSQTAKSEAAKKLYAYLVDKIDLTAFLVWFVENFPGSQKEMMLCGFNFNRFS